MMKIAKVYAVPLIISAVISAVITGLGLLLFPTGGVVLSVLLTVIGSIIALAVFHTFMSRQIAAMTTGGGQDGHSLFDGLVKSAVERVETRYLKTIGVVSQTIEKSTLSLAATSHRVDQLKKNTHLATLQSEEVALAANRILVTTRQSKESAVNAAQFAVQTKNDSTQGRIALQQAINDLNLMRNRTQETTGLVARLTDSSKKIQEITQVIEAVAKQINCLR
jgi:methyl-accepting chemotaxis protein